MKRILIVPLLLALLYLTGCATTRMAPDSSDQLAKSFEPVQDKASLYIYRNETFGAAISMPVTVNGKMLGKTVSKSYFHLNLAPGQYNIESIAENTASLPITAEANKSYYIWQEVKMGLWMARSKLQEVTEEIGKAGVLESKLIYTEIDEKDISPVGLESSSPVKQNRSLSEKLLELDKMKADGLITEEEFNSKKVIILKSL